jgi:hypothetical protein
VLCRFRYSSSSIISTASTEERASREGEWTNTPWNEDKDVHDLEAKGRNVHKELPSVLWALQTNINRASRDTPFNLVYYGDAILPLEIYLQSVRVAHFNEEN